MSRCFPYTPRWCVRNGGNTGAALIESIKLQNSEKSQKNVKKERKTHKEERKKLRDSCDRKVPSVGDQKSHEHERRRKTGEKKRKHSQNGNEQVERSNLTEEHGHPLHFQNPAYLSDSTHSSDKRKNDSTLLDYSDHPEKRRAGMETAENHPADSINKRNIKLPLCNISTNRRVEALELQYKNLTESWTLEQFQSMADNFDDTDWLFGASHTERPSSNSNLKQHKACRSVSLWPRAQYLPEASIYALPYSLPF